MCTGARVSPATSATSPAGVPTDPSTEESVSRPTTRDVGHLLEGHRDPAAPLLSASLSAGARVSAGAGAASVSAGPQRCPRSRSRSLCATCCRALATAHSAVPGGLAGPCRALPPPHLCRWTPLRRSARPHSAHTFMSSVRRSSHSTSSPVSDSSDLSTPSQMLVAAPVAGLRTSSSSACACRMCVRSPRAPSAPL